MQKFLGILIPFLLFCNISFLDWHFKLSNDAVGNLPFKKLDEMLTEQ